MARFILPKPIFSRTDLMVTGHAGYKYLLPNIVETIGFEIFINGIYEEETSSFIVRRLPQGGIFLDLGANIGAIAVPVAKRRPDVSTVAVEAAPWIFRYLNINLEQNAAKARAINRALFHTDGQMVPFYSPREKFGKGSLTPVFTSEPVLVPTVRMDSLVAELGLERVDLIKIDVEGFESHAFAGARKLLTQNDAPDILFEFVDWAETNAGVAPGSAQRLLIEMGYRLFSFSGNKPMKPVENIFISGFHMFFATKKPGL